MHCTLVSIFSEGQDEWIMYLRKNALSQRCGKGVVRRGAMRLFNGEVESITSDGTMVSTPHGAYNISSQGPVIGGGYVGTGTYVHSRLCELRTFG